MSVYTGQQSQLGQQPYQVQQPYPYSPGQQFGQPQTPFGQQTFGQMGQQFGQQFGQQPWAQGFGFGTTTQQPYGMQQPYGLGQFGPQALLGQAQMPMAGAGQLPLLVTDLALKCAASAITAVVEQLRLDPQALYAVQAQGQIPPHLYSMVLTECARRVAPLLHTTLATISGQPVPGQQQIPGQGIGQPAPGQQQFGPFGMQQPFPAWGPSPLMGAGI